MSFADTYLKRYASVRVSDPEKPDPDLFLSIVIPVYNEPDLTGSLESLLSADPPGCPWEIIIVINEPRGCPDTHHHQNIATIQQINDLRTGLVRDDLKIHVIKPDPYATKKAGPGMARKMGMDESIRRFNQLKRPDGVIVSFDADTACSAGYLTELAGFYKMHPEAGGCTVYFEHPVDPGSFQDAVHHRAIVQYELYLRYFRFCLDWINFPYSCYSLGSAFSVRADRYVNAGGMGTQQAGEDFYFLQKCLPLGNFWELNKTAVYPSSRMSDRVVFGTGPVISSFVEERKEELTVYPFELFKGIRPFFLWIDKLDKLPLSFKEIELAFLDIDPIIRNKAADLKWLVKLKSVFEHSAGIKSFRKRFYHEINLLQIIKLFNELEQEAFPGRGISGEFAKLGKYINGIPESGDTMTLLSFARNRDKAKGSIRIA